MKFLSYLVLLIIISACAQMDRQAQLKHARAHMEKKFDSNDYDHDGLVSHKEYLKSKDIKFKEMDGNGDGFMTKDEKMDWTLNKKRFCKTCVLK